MYDTFIISSRKDLPYPLTHSVCPLLYQKHLLNRGNPKLFPVLIFKEKGRSWLFYYHFFSLPLLFFWDLPPDSHMTWEYNMLLTPSASLSCPIYSANPASSPYLLCFKHKQPADSIHAILQELLVEQLHARDALLLVRRAVTQAACYLSAIVSTEPVLMYLVGC